jgi:hypothetical protein
MTGGRHWLAMIPVRRADGELVGWYDVDSKLDEPVYIGNSVDALVYSVRVLVEQEDAQAFLVIDEAVQTTTGGGTEAPDKQT